MITPRITLLLTFTLLSSTGCTAFIKEWYAMPEPIERQSVPTVPNWAGVAVTVVDVRRLSAEPVKRWVDAGLTWHDYSDALVQHTRAALLDALGPARPGSQLELQVRIVEHIVRFHAPNWVGNTVLEASLLDRGQSTDQRWTARGQDSRWNWLGLDTARSASQAAYEAAVKDLLRQLALSRAPRLLGLLEEAGLLLGLHGYDLRMNGQRERRWSAAWAAETDALEALTHRLKDIEARQGTPPERKTLGEVAEEYLRYKANAGKRSLREDRRILTRRLLPTFGAATPIRTLTTADIGQYERRRIGEVSAFTVANELGVLRHLLPAGAAGDRSPRSHGEPVEQDRQGVEREDEPTSGVEKSPRASLGGDRGLVATRLRPSEMEV